MSGVDKQNFHWLIGILEGEGTFLAAPPSAPSLPVLRVSMTDEDVVMRAAALIDRAVVRLGKRQEHHRQPFATTIKGAPAAILMRSVQPWLGARRRAQIDLALTGLGTLTVRMRRIERSCAVPTCARPCAVRGLCRHHYNLWWKAQRHGRKTRYVPVDRASDRDAIGHEVGGCSSECDRSWLAGLLEGEGCFGLAQQRGRNAYPTIEIQMCDEDVVTRAAQLLGACGVTRRQPTKPHWSAMFTTKIVGAAAAELMLQLRPLMGHRRQAAIDKALAAYAPIRLTDPPATCVVPGCGAPHRSRGLCHKHYMRWMRDLAKGRTPRVTPLR